MDPLEKQMKAYLDTTRDLRKVPYKEFNKDEKSAEDVVVGQLAYHLLRSPDVIVDVTRAFRARLKSAPPGVQKDAAQKYYQDAVEEVLSGSDVDTLKQSAGLQRAVFELALMD